LESSGDGEARKIKDISLKISFMQLGRRDRSLKKSVQKLSFFCRSKIIHHSMNNTNKMKTNETLKIDLYTKIVLTTIALSLVSIVFRDVPIISSAKANPGDQRDVWWHTEKQFDESSQTEVKKGDKMLEEAQKDPADLPAPADQGDKVVKVQIISIDHQIGMPWDDIGVKQAWESKEDRKWRMEFENR
jgi:hypothetical protein